MKKILPILLVILFCFSACSTDIDDTSQGESTLGETAVNSESTTTDETTQAENTDDISGDFEQCKVVRVVDGDTIVIDYEGSDEKVRLIGVDTPESVHPDKSKNTEFGKTVSDYSKGQLDGKTVGIEFDVQERDQYGRLLAYVYVGDQMYNKSLLEKGYASVATFPPNVKYVDDFTAIQKEARAKGVGMWAPEFSDSSTAEKKKDSSASGEYLAHIKNKKFHGQGCRYGDMISEQNLQVFMSRDAAINEGFAPCKVCNP